ncbi:PREDICTED: RAN GTPase-activating protein 2 [Camelina sativa]|uniref:RAN GTPase-activating protein 2 n=1 Tax=Camelina sativa TaxID=90675 RepID=A0ABM0WAE6_CAMSA|nr:PREDICTED: RAN GTPase-activating protein 2 [Camelina sativa]
MEENTFMKQLYLMDHCIKVGVSMIKVFPSFNFLTVINLSYTKLENEGAIAFVNALKSSAPSLEVIELAGNNITDEAAPAIAACLAAKRHLKKLNLSQNDLEDEGCVDIVESMEDLELEYVDMSYNKLTRRGALNLAHIVVTKESLKMLNIDGNMISVRGIEEVKEIFKNFPKLLGPLDENVDDDDDDDDLRERNDLEDFEDEFVSYFIYY